MCYESKTARSAPASSIASANAHKKNMYPVDAYELPSMNIAVRIGPVAERDLSHEDDEYRDRR